MRDPELSFLSRGGVARLSQEVRDAIEAAVFRVSRRAFLSVTSTSGADEAEQYETGITDPKGQAPARRFQHYGFRSRPPARSEVICLNLHGKASNRVYVASEAPGTGPQSQQEGEVELYSKDGHRLALLADGRILFRDKTGAEMIFDGGRLLRGKDLYTGGVPVALSATPDIAIVSTVGRDSFFEVNVSVVNPVAPTATLFGAVFSSAFPAVPLVLCAERTTGKKISWSQSAAAVTVTAQEALNPGPDLTVVVHAAGAA